MPARDDWLATFFFLAALVLLLTGSVEDVDLWPLLMCSNLELLLRFLTVIGVSGASFLFLAATDLVTERMVSSEIGFVPKMGNSSPRTCYMGAPTRLQ